MKYGLFRALFVRYIELLVLLRPSEIGLIPQRVIQRFGAGRNYVVFERWFGEVRSGAAPVASRIFRVLAHPFPNGNGRHARLAADLLIKNLGGKPFSWGSGSIADTGEIRKTYVTALRLADNHDIRDLMAFARSLNRLIPRALVA